MGSAIFLDDPRARTGDNQIEDRHGFAARFAKDSTQELISQFNREVGITAWVSARGHFLYHLIAEFHSRGLGLGSVLDGDVLSMNQRVRLNSAGDRLEPLP